MTPRRRQRESGPRPFATSDYGIAVHSACKGFGYTLDEWDDSEQVDPLVRYYHEVAEYLLLHRDGMEPPLPLEREDDERESAANSPQRGPEKTIRTGAGAKGR